MAKLITSNSCAGLGKRAEQEFRSVRLRLGEKMAELCIQKDWRETTDIYFKIIYEQIRRDW